MASKIHELFGYPVEDPSPAAAQAVRERHCPFLGARCEKTFNDNSVSGVCTIKPMTTPPVICCPIRLYADSYRVLRDVAEIAFRQRLELVPGKEALAHAGQRGVACVAVFGKGWGGELRLPQKGGRGGYFVDWVLAKIDPDGTLVEFTAVEVQTIDTTGSYRMGFDSLIDGGPSIKTSAGLNWENVSKRILPQLIYKGQVLQRESLCRAGLFFICPEPVRQRIMDRLGGRDHLVRYTLQPAAITFLSYDFDPDQPAEAGRTTPLAQVDRHTTTVYKLQEAFNNVTLPDENVFRDAILDALR